MKFAVVSAFALLISLTAFAQSPEVSTLPVTEPLEVGGVILQPGTYMIRVLPSPADRNKVQITSPDRDKVYATLLTVPHALDPNEEVTNTTFVYFPAGEGMPRALRTWFAPNTSASFGGHDIVYEQTRAEQLARVSKSNVVSYTGTTQVADFDNTELHVITPEAKVETYTYVAPAPTPAPMISSERETTVQVADATPMEMPGTASNVPLIALLGLASLAGAFAVRMARN
ncbi:MAG: hypothetical protein ABI779_11740 [Acidobacteriota bacterium]